MKSLPVFGHCYSLNHISRCPNVLVSVVVSMGRIRRVARVSIVTMMSRIGGCNIRPQVTKNKVAFYYFLALFLFFSPKNFMTQFIFVHHFCILAYLAELICLDLHRYFVIQQQLKQGCGQTIAMVIFKVNVIAHGRHRASPSSDS